MKALFILISIASIAANICFLSGCASFHATVYGTPCKFAPPIIDGKPELIRIASLLGIKTADKSASDLANDIHYILDRSYYVPSPLTEAEMSVVGDLLSSSEFKAIKELNNFVSELQRKHIIVVQPEEN